MKRTERFSFTMLVFERERLSRLAKRAGISNAAMLRVLINKAAEENQSIRVFADISAMPKGDEDVNGKSTDR